MINDYEQESQSFKLVSLMTKNYTNDRIRVKVGANECIDGLR